jgi:NAD(P)-dependent dehydrogenase (short-subunit alcohol dehydrogenase family)
VHQWNGSKVQPCLKVGEKAQINQTEQKSLIIYTTKDANLDLSLIQTADVVVDAIRSAGGTAVANYDSVEQGDRIIQTAIQNWGRIDILINNAGILRDITVKNMTDKDWDLIMTVHVTGAYRTSRAAWPHFRRQNFGRIINTSSTSGLYGNFGQANYAGKYNLIKPLLLSEV